MNEQEFREKNGEFSTLEDFKAYIKDDGYAYLEFICQFVLDHCQDLCDSFATIYETFCDFYELAKRRVKS